MDLVAVASYRRAESRADLALAPGETVVSGGTWLFSEPQPATTGLVDLTTLGWEPWERIATGLRIAATCTVEQLLAVPADALGDAHALVRQCGDAFLMSFKIQRFATVGGNICLGLPAGAMISLMSALDADAVIWTPDGGERRQPVASLVTDVRTTTLAAGEVLRAVEIPTASLSGRVAFRQISLATYGRSSTVVIARSSASGTTFTVTAATTRPVQLGFLQPPHAGELAAAVGGIDCWYADAHGPVDWRAAMSARLAEECRREVGLEATR